MDFALLTSTSQLFLGRGKAIEHHAQCSWAKMLALQEEEKRMSGLIGGTLLIRPDVFALFVPLQTSPALSIFNSQHLTNTPDAAPTTEIGTAACLSHMRQGCDAHARPSSAAATTLAFQLHTRDSYLYINTNTSGSSGQPGHCSAGLSGGMHSICFEVPG